MGPDDLHARPAGPPKLEVAATIDAEHTLTVWGLGPDPLVAEHLEQADARNALINLLHDRATALDGLVLAAARTPAGPWYFAVIPGLPGRTLHWDEADFTLTAPDLAPPTNRAGAAALAAAMPSTPEAVLALASDPDPAVRATALVELDNWADDLTPVADAQLPADRLAVLAGCALSWVRAGVAANPGTDPGTLVDLVDDDDPLVRLALAGRFDLDPEVSIHLAGDPDPGVRAELGRNPAASFLTRTGGGGVAVATHPAPTSAGDHGPGPRDLGSENPPHPTATAADPAPTRLPRRSLGALVAAAAVVLLAVGGYAAVTTLGTDPAPTASVSATVPWNGMSLPTGPDGPADPAGPVAAGFAHTELGAAMAAAHLSVRIDPYAGPASFEPTITTQTFGGDPAALLGATQDRYDTAAARAGITDGGPIPTSTGQILGWSTDGWAPDYPTTVHLLVTSPDGTNTDYAIGVVWVDGDYQLLDPTRADTFTTTPAADPATYQRF